ncbi:MAG: hypothetical protein IT423_03050 [Pirellulaceae bacterium]|nr:hypothetical protein [Pirellulaceae bacterium]
MRSTRHDHVRRLSLFLLVACLGCGSSPTISRPASSSSAGSAGEPVAGGTSEKAAESVGNDQTSNSQPATQAPLGEQKPSGTSQSASVKPTSPSTPIANSTAAQAVVPQVPKPTAEQLARWKHVAFDTLQLLAYCECETAGFVSYAAAIHDGKHYLLGGTKLTLWKVGETKQVHEFIAASSKEDERLLSFAVSPVGQWCLAGNAKGLLRKFDLAGLKEISSKPTGTNGIVRMAISPDGQEIATVPYVSEVTIWDANTLEKKSSFTVDTNEVKHLQYTAPQVLIAAGETMSTWNTESGKKIKTFPSEKYQTAVAVTGNGKEILFGASEALTRWNLSDDRAVGEYRGVPSRNSTIRLSSDGKLVAVASANMVNILDAASGQMVQVIDGSGSAISDLDWMPNSHLLLVGTERGRTRIWGRPEEGKTLGLPALPAPAVTANSTPKSPATTAENLQVVDLRLLPKLPNSKPQSDNFATSSYSAPVGVEEVKTFYRTILAERGWAESFDQATQYSLAFRKNGFLLNISFYGDKPTESFVSATLLGNYDLRQTPKLDEYRTATVYEGDASSIYKVKANLLQIETELLKKLHAAGWTAIARLNRSQNESKDERDMEFVKNGTVLRVTVQRDRDDAALFVVSYGMSLSLHTLPVPPDAGLMEWDDNQETQMVANTSLSLEQATAFYDDAMKSQGWLPRETGRRIAKDVVYLPYRWGQRDVTIALAPTEDKMVRIRAGEYSQQSWQKPAATGAAVSNETQTPSTDSGIEAADFPILHAAGPATYQADYGQIKFELEKTSLVKLSQEYSDALKALGWTTRAFGDPKEESVSLNFEKGSNSISYQSAVDPRGIGTVSVSGSGLLWTKAIALKQRVAYTSWLRNHKYPASLKRLGEYYLQMEKLP